MVASLVAGVASLWLPIVLSAVIVFLASTIIHMGPFWHRGDYPPMPREAEVLGALGPLAIPPGDYFIPRASGMAAMRSPEFKDKLKRGPVIVMTVLPNGMINMTRSLTQWFVFLIVVGIFVAVVTSHTLPADTSYPRVFKVAGIVAFMGYSLALCELSIWYRRSWSLTLKAAVDGVIYAALTAGTFGWLWPR
ncbi:MAG TPA: hypothetical protein VK803_10565 [Steroidobacteraceae bacterium]|jgi:hypothetical protein|nr:hypothetical protein [Steroidobacteraceae bacterium]